MNALMDVLAPYLSALSGPASALDPTAELGMAPGGMLSQLAAQQGGGAPVGASDPNANRWEQLAQQMAAQRGWGPRQFNALDKIATAESGWNPGAVNPSSGAAGIPQMLPSAHPDINVQQFLHDPREQIQWMLNYIQGRYGNPVNAWNTRETRGWY